MRYRALLLLLVAVILGSLAAYLVNNIVTQQVAQPITQEQSVGIPTVIASADLPVGLLLQNSHLQVVELPEAAVPSGAYQTIPEVLAGEAPIVMSSMRAGEVVLSEKLSTGVAIRGLTARIPDGARAVSIPVNEVRGVGGFVLPGDRVDVLHTTTVGRRDDRPVTRTLLQDMIVLGVDQVSSEATEDPIVVNVITLLANPEQAKSLTLAQQVGDLTLLLRNEGDRGSDDSPTVALDDLWDYGPEDARVRATTRNAGSAATESAAVQRQSGRRDIQIIRGLEVRDVAVQSAPSLTEPRPDGQN